MRTLVVLIAILGVVGCGGNPITVVRSYDPQDPRAPAWSKSMTDAELASRTVTAAEAAVRAWGGGPEDLDDWSIVYVVGDVQPGAENGLASELPRGGVILVNIEDTACLEVTALAHEVGHAVGNWGHSDSRWRSVDFAKKVGAEMAAPLVPTTVCAKKLRAGHLIGLPID